METSPDWLWSVLLPGALVLVAGLLLDYLIRRRSGAYRRSLWCGVWFALVALPVLSAFTPRQFSLLNDDGINEPTSYDALDRSDIVDDTTFSVPKVQPNLEDIKGVASTPPEVEHEIEADKATPWLLVLWGVGASLLLIRLMVGWCLLSWRIHRSRRVSDRDLPGFLRMVDLLKLKRIPRIYTSDQVGVPMCCGVFRPTILLPETTVDNAKPEALELVLLHEGVHLQQKDALWLWLAHFVVIVHWMNPLAWIAMARFRLAQEQTCDDVVLNRDFSATDYSTLLVTMAKGRGNFSSFTSALTLAMARPSILKKRLRHILDPEMKRNKPTKIRRLITMMSILTLAAAACTIGLRSSTAQDEPAEPPKAAEEPASASGEDLVITNARELVTGFEGTVSHASQHEAVFDSIIISEIKFENQPANLAITDLTLLVNDQLEHGEVNFVLLKEAQTKTTNDLTRLQKLLEEERQRLHQAQSIRDALAVEYGVIDGSQDAESGRLNQLLDAISAAEQRFTSMELLLSQIGHLDEEQKLRYLLRQESEETSLLRNAYQAFIDAKAANAGEEEMARVQETFRVELDQHQRTVMTEYEMAHQELEALKERHTEAVQRALARRSELSEYLRSEKAYARAMENYEYLEKAISEERVNSDEAVPVTNLQLKNVSLSNVLKYITQMAGLKYLVQDSTVVIGTENELMLFTEDLEPGSFQIR